MSSNRVVIFHVDEDTGFIVMFLGVRESDAPYATFGTNAVMNVAEIAQSWLMKEDQKKKAEKKEPEVKP